MTTTGWTGEDVEGPALPATELLLSHRAERGPVDPLERARLARDEPDGDPFDADERAANLVARGVVPGMLTDLGQRLADAEGELAAEREKIARGERTAARVRRMLELGQVGAMEASRMLDGDFGDEHRAGQLERRAERMRRQLADAQAMVAPRSGEPADAVEAATRGAHDVFVEATRQRVAQAQAGVRPVRRPFASISRGSSAGGEVTCGECVAVGASVEESFAIHHPELLPAQDEDSDAGLAEFGREIGIPYRPAERSARAEGDPAMVFNAYRQEWVPPRMIAR